MQIVEVKNDIAKIKYSSANNHLLPSDFLLIQDGSLKFIAQVLNIETTDDSVLNIATLRLCLSIDSEDNLSFYNGYIIGKSAKVNYISSEEIVDLISDERDNVYFGNLTNHNNTYVKTNCSFVNDKLYIQSDKSEKTTIIVKNLASQLISLNKKVLIIDFDNQYTDIPNARVLKVGEDFKLPLNTVALDNLIEKDLEDCLLEDKAFVQSIILELREYIQSLPDKFLQFSLFRDVINNQYNENPLANLMVLRNKLWLYAQNNLFADVSSDFLILNDEISDNNCVVIDASNVADKWQNVLVLTVKELISENCYLFLNFDGMEVNKKFINDILLKKNIIPIFSSSYNNPCRALLSLLSKNQILCKPSFVLEENVQYIDFVNKLNHEEFIIFGEATLYLPLLLAIQQFDMNTVNSVVENDIKRDVDKLFTGGVSQVAEMKQEEIQEIVESSVLLNDVQEDEQDILLEDENPIDFIEEVVIDEIQEVQEIEQVQENQTIEELQEIIEDNSEELIETNDEIVETNQEESIHDDDILDDDLDFLDELSLEDENNDNLSLDNDVMAENIDEIEGDEEVLSDLIKEELIENHEEQVEEVEKENLDENTNVENELDKDNSSVNDFYENVDSLPKEEQSVEDSEELTVEELGEQNQENILDDEQDDTDEKFSFIDNENQEVEEVEEAEAETVDEEEDDDDFLEINENIGVEEVQNIPVYETDIQPNLNPEDIPFKVGDKVFHPKHGNGIVQGFTNYSDKILFCQIEFENVGRRILDPRVAQLEKI